jgi:type I restriction enzyme R subunit
MDKTPEDIRIDEKNHVEEPLLTQLEELGWEGIRLDTAQSPGDSFREQFSETVMLPVLRDAVQAINPWLADDQLESVIRQATTPSATGLLENNRHVHQLLLEGTSVVPFLSPLVHPV